MRKLTTALTLCLTLSAMSCAGFKETAKEAANEALRDAAPVLRDLGKELADHAAARLGEAGGKLIGQAKDDIGGAVKSIPGAAADAASRATVDVIKGRMANDPKLAPFADEFAQRAQSEGLGEAFKWLSGVSGTGVIGLVWALLRTKKGQANAEDKAATMGDALAAVTSAVELHAAEPVKRAVEAFTSNRPDVGAAIRAVIPQMKKA